jgi:hypothetical protein
LNQAIDHSEGGYAPLPNLPPERAPAKPALGATGLGGLGPTRFRRRASGDVFMLISVVELMVSPEGVFSGIL